MDEIYVWMDVEWMKLLCMCICVIFQFKTGVKLKRGCVKLLLQSYFQQLEKPHRKQVYTIFDS
jgi:hypothetical protein